MHFAAVRDQLLSSSAGARPGEAGGALAVGRRADDLDGCSLGGFKGTPQDSYLDLENCLDALFADFNCSSPIVEDWPSLHFEQPSRAVWGYGCQLSIANGHPA